jgi:hypothetical protein
MDRRNPSLPAESAEVLETALRQRGGGDAQEERSGDY